MLNILKSQVPERIQFVAKGVIEMDTSWLDDWLILELHSDEATNAYKRVWEYLSIKLGKTIEYIKTHYGKLPATERGMRLLSQEFNRIAFGDETSWSVVWDLVNNKRDVDGSVK